VRTQSASHWIASGQTALQRGQWSRARNAFRRALSIQPSAEGREGLGWALYWLGAVEESLQERENAYRDYLDRKDRVDAARVAIGLAVGSYDLRGASATSGWLERARTLLRAEPVSIIHGWLAFYEGHVARLTGENSKEARKLARNAARIGARFDDPQLELLASALEGLTLVNEGRIAEGMRRVDEATTAAMAGEMRDLDAVAQTCCILLYACERVRDYKRAVEWQQRIGEFCRRWKIEPLFAVCSTQRAAMLTGCGDWSEAETELHRTLQRLEKTRPLLVPDAIVQLAELRRRQGRHDDAKSLLARVPARTEAMLTHAAIALDSGDPTTAIDYAERVLGRHLGEKWVERAIALSLIVRAALETGDRTHATQAHARLLKISREVDAPMIEAIERSAAAALAAHSGANDEARAAYVESLERFDAASAPFEAACVRVSLARTLIDLGRPSAAAREIETSLATFDRLGAVRERRQALDLQRELEARPADGSTTAPPLTRRESEVLHLIAEGFGDKQLAVRLSLSEHTVHRHVANILRKLGAGSRTAAVAQAMRSGWL
jgi:ATP/maltotriose-dependent transcriptional regulator MalT